LHACPYDDEPTMRRTGFAWVTWKR
jgi:hypothetical protein